MSPASRSLTEIEKQRRKEKAKHLQCIPEALHKTLVWHFPNHGKDRVGQLTKTDTDLLTQLERYFTITKNVMVGSQRFHSSFLKILGELGFNTSEKAAGYLRTRRNFYSNNDMRAPLHVAAIGLAYERIDHYFLDIARNPALAHLRSPYTTSEVLEHLQYSDLKKLDAIVLDSFSSVAEIVSLLVYEAQSPEEAIAIIQKNLEPFPDKDARGFSAFELLSNTVFTFWGNLPGTPWKPNGVVDKDGRVTKTFIGAVHRLISLYPQFYHGGCVNRYAVGDFQESAVNESVRIFLEYYKDAIERLRPYA